MAVAAHERSFSLYALKSMDEIREAVQAEGSMDERRFQPVREVSISTSENLGRQGLILTSSSGRKGIFKWKGRY